MDVEHFTLAREVQALDSTCPLLATKDSFIGS